MQGRKDGARTEPRPLELQSPDSFPLDEIAAWVQKVGEFSWGSGSGMAQWDDQESGGRGQ